MRHLNRHKLAWITVAVNCKFSFHFSARFLGISSYSVVLYIELKIFAGWNQKKKSENIIAIVKQSILIEFHIHAHTVGRPSYRMPRLAFFFFVLACERRYVHCIANASCHTVWAKDFYVHTCDISSAEMSVEYLFS